VLRRSGQAIAVLGLAAGVAACGGTESTSGGASAVRLDLAQPWMEADPAAVGLDGARLDAAALQAAAIPRGRSLLVARHGRIALERYFADGSQATAFDVRSVTKSVVSALLGIAIRDGALPSLEMPIGGYLEPPYLLDAESAAITAHQLATMTSGFEWNDDVDYDPWLASPDHVQFLLDRPHVAAPGTLFTYNSAAVHVLGVVVQRATRTPLSDYAQARLFGPIGVGSARWQPLDRGTVNGGSGIRLRARDMLTYGQLYLQQGFSGTRAVVPASWVAETTRPQFPWRDDYGAQRSTTYGILWWVSDAQPAAFFAWGYGGQFIYVVPSLDLVVVTTTMWQDLSGADAVALAEQELGVIVDEVLPAAGGS